MTVTDPTTQSTTPGSGDPTGASLAPGANANLPPGVSAQGQLAPFNPNAGGATGGGLGGIVQAPAITQAPYEYSKFVNEQVILGPWVGHLLGFSAKASGGAIQVNKILQAYMALSGPEQNILLSYLWSAGFYLDSSGSIPQTAPSINEGDPLNQAAVSNMLATTYNKNSTAKVGGSTASSVTASLIQSGAGAQELQQLPPPINAGGSTYQNLVTNPSDLYNTLYTTFYNALGQAPTQDQLDHFVGTFQSEQSKVQQAANAQTEASRYNVFLEQERARNLQMQYNRTPRIAGGAVPTGPFHTPSAWAAAFTSYLNQALGIPDTASNVAYITSLIHRLGNGLSTNNPLGVTLAAPGPVSIPRGNVNPNAPAKYTSSALGMQFTLNALATLPGVVSLLQSGDASNPAVQKQWTTSAMGDFTAELGKFTNGKVKGPITPTAGEVAAAEHAWKIIQRNPPPTKQAAIAPAPRPAPAPTAPPTTATGPPVAQTGTTPTDLTGQTFGPPAAGFPGSQPPPLSVGQQQQVKAGTDLGVTEGAPAPADPNAKETLNGKVYIPVPGNSPTGYVWSGGPAPAPVTAPGSPAGPAPQPGTEAWRATHPPTGPGFNQAAINPVLAAQQPAGMPTVNPAQIPGTQAYGPTSLQAAAPGGQVTQPPAVQPAKGSPTANEPTIAQAKQQAMGGRTAAAVAPTGVAGTTLPTTPAADLTGGQNQYSALDTYVPATTLTGVANPQDASKLAFEMATTGANAVPYQVNQYLNDFEVIASMIANGGPTG